MTGNPQITNPEDFGYPQNELQSEQPGQQYPSAEELTRQIFTISPPKPQFDQAKADRLQKMSRINSLGRGVNVLGDVLSLGLGANVRRRQPDAIAPGINATFESMMDKYKGEKDAYRFQEYQKQLNNLQFGVGRADRREDKAYQKQVHLDQLKAQAAKNALDWNKFSATYAQKGQDLDLKRQKQGQDAWHDQATIKLGYDKINAELTKYFDKENKFMQIEVNGQVISLNEGQFRGLLKDAVSDPAYKKGDLKAMLDGFTNNPLEGSKNIVQRYSEWLAAQQSLQSQQPAVDQLVNGGSVNQAIGNAMSPMNGSGPMQSYGNQTSQSVAAPTAGFDPSKYESKE